MGKIDCVKCGGTGEIKTTDPVLFRPQIIDCKACEDEGEKIAHLATQGFVWSDCDLKWNWKK